LKSNSFFYQLQQQTAKPIDREIVCFAKERRELACQKIDSVYQDFAQGNTKSTKFLESMTTDTLIDIAKDLDIFLAISLNPLEKGYPSRHSLQMASMAMAIGTVHGLNREELIELGIGCLIHDAGMLHLRDKTYDSSQEFGMHEHLSITKHPILTQQLLQSCKDVPKSSLLVSYQMHERGDGSGYPRGRYGTQIHYLAKIGMVADVYVALTSERPHRPAYHPYHAIEQILHQTNQNKLDPSVVRSLLHTISLFPINSYVELSDNSPARVIRANRLDFTKPVVEVWNWKDLEAMPLQINLQEQKDLKVIRPIEEFPLKSEAMG
jgi:HD-GYP domain-containing protein (c-di-GMP phosphodiesterase class II)